MDEVLAAMRD